MADSLNLAGMKLPELKELAKRMGLRGVSTMRKNELVETIQAARSGGQAPAGVSIRVSATPVDGSVEGSGVSATQHNADGQDNQQEQPVRNRREMGSSKREYDEQATLDVAEALGASEAAREHDVDDSDSTERRPHRASAQQHRGSRVDRDERQDRAERASHSRREHVRRNVRGTQEENSSREEHAENRTLGGLDLDLNLPRRRRRDTSEESAEVRSARARDLSDILDALPDRSERADRNNDRNADRKARRNRNADRNANDRQDRNDRENSRNTRAEQNDRPHRADRSDRENARQERDTREAVARDLREAEHESRNAHNAQAEEEQNPAEELVPVAGIIDVLESYAFVRTSGYLPGPNDVYVSMGQVKKYGLRKGDAVQGTTRPPHEGRSQRQKFVPLQTIESINGMTVEEAQQRPHFNKLTPLYPQERLRMETVPAKLTGRLIDIVSPIGKGQRGLIVSPPKAGKTITLQNIANSITANNPEVHLMVVLVDERPEEVTDMERTVQGEVISSTFDRPASDHTIVAELAIERAKRLVELGQDVVVLLDSMTRLARAYNIAQPASGRILSGGVDAQALYPPKKFFGAARNIENGGSLTIISSALVETGSKMDEVIFEEFKGTGNMELRLSRDLADKRLFPAIDINASGTRREELITPQSELAIVYRLRRLMGGMEPEQAYQTLVPRLKKTQNNHEFLAGIAAGNQK